MATFEASPTAPAIEQKKRQDEAALQSLYKTHGGTLGYGTDPAVAREKAVADLRKYMSQAGGTLEQAIQQRTNLAHQLVKKGEEQALVGRLIKPLGTREQFIEQQTPGAETYEAARQRAAKQIGETGRSTRRRAFLSARARGQEGGGAIGEQLGDIVQAEEQARADFEAQLQQDRAAKYAAASQGYDKALERARLIAGDMKLSENTRRTMINDFLNDAKEEAARIEAQADDDFLSSLLGGIGTLAGGAIGFFGSGFNPMGALAGASIGGAAGRGAGGLISSGRRR